MLSCGILLRRLLMEIYSRRHTMSWTSSSWATRGVESGGYRLMCTGTAAPVEAGRSATSFPSIPPSKLTDTLSCGPPTSSCMPLFTLPSHLTLMQYALVGYIFRRRHFWSFTLHLYSAAVVIFFSFFEMMKYKLSVCYSSPCNVSKSMPS